MRCCIATISILPNFSNKIVLGSGLARWFGRGISTPSLQKPGGGTLMVMLLCAAALGVILGLRFRIFVILPVMLVAAAGITVLGVWSGQDFHITALNLVAAGVSLQIGYFIGAILAEYRKRKTELQPTGDRAVIHAVIYSSEPNSGGERDQWVLVSDPQSG